MISEGIETQHPFPTPPLNWKLFPSWNLDVSAHHQCGPQVGRGQTSGNKSGRGVVDQQGGLKTQRQLKCSGK